MTSREEHAKYLATGMHECASDCPIEPRSQALRDVLAREASAEGSPHAESFRRAAPRAEELDAAEWHRYLHREGILVADEGEECGPWHHRVFLSRPS